MYSYKELDNGIKVVMESMDNVRSVAFGIWVRVGSRYEDPKLNGISHFLEHLFFKGTNSRSAQDIAVEIDSLGGELNAFTSKEGTTFYVKILDEYLTRGVELVSDIFQDSIFPTEEIEKEKGVVIEEINMTFDTPDDYVYDVFNETVWGKTGIGQTVLGPQENIKAITRDDIINHIEKFYTNDNIVISCAGNFDENELMELLNRSLGGMKRKGDNTKIVTPQFQASTSVVARDLSEAHICLGVPGIKQASDDRYAALLVNTIVGGGISSRLFQEIREKRGLVYTVYSFLSSYMDTGLMGVYAGTGKDRVPEVIQRALKQLRILADTITEEELIRAKSQLRGSIVLGQESTSRRMQNIANQQIYYGKYISPKEVLAAIDKVTMDDVTSRCKAMVSGDKVALTVLGPLDESDIAGCLD
jgi:predicted Zn-dependent peptidase